MKHQLQTDPSHDVSSVPAQVSQLVHDVGQDPEQDDGDDVDKDPLIIIIKAITCSWTRVIVNRKIGYKVRKGNLTRIKDV